MIAGRNMKHKLQMYLKFACQEATFSGVCISSCGILPATGRFQFQLKLCVCYAGSQYLVQCMFCATKCRPKRVFVYFWQMQH